MWKNLLILLASHLAFLVGSIAWATSSIPMRCIDDSSGAIVGGTEQNSCRNLLPKCSALHDDYKSKAFQNLSMKIYGYLKGYDIDTTKTTLQTKVGTPMPFRVCRVVGNKIKYQGDHDLEFEYRNLPNAVTNFGKEGFTGQDCGEYPKVSVDRGARKINLSFEGGSGSAVTAMMLGAMPYEIRAKAYQFFQDVQNPSDLDSHLTASELQSFKDDFKTTHDMMDSYFSSLSPEAKAVCTSTSYSNLTERCLGTATPFSATDPALRLCSLAKASLALKQGSAASMIEFQIMKNARDSYDQHFNSLLDPNNSPLWNALISKAAEDSGWWDCTLRLEGQRKCAANVVSGVMGDGAYRIYNDWSGQTTTDSPARARVGQRFFGFYLDPGASATRAQLPGNSAPYLRGGIYLSGSSWSSIIAGLLSPLTLLLSWANNAFSDAISSENYGGGLSQLGAKRLTLSSGIAGIIEKIIRVDICGQNAVTANSPQCDETDIPNKPPGVEW